MARINITLRQRVKLNLLPKEKAQYGLTDQDSHLLDLPAGLVSIPEELAEHWMIKNCIQQAQQPLMGQAGGIAPPLPINPSQVKAAGDTDTGLKDDKDPLAKDTILSAEELDAKSDDELREYLRTAGNQQVAADAPRDRVLARIEKLRPKEA